MKGTGYNLAGIIMRESFMGHLCKSYGLKKRGVKMEQMLDLARAPFSKETLVKRAGSHLLVAMPPMSLLDMNMDRDLKRMFCPMENPWYANQMFAKDIFHGWHLIPKITDPVYFGKNWVEQTNIIPAGQKVATAATVIYAMIARYRATGEMLYVNTRIRCADVPGGRGSGKHVYIAFSSVSKKIVIGESDDMESYCDLATEVAPE